MTIKDMARMANVSISTVSKVINEKYDGISEETRNRVLKIVKEYNYAPYAKNLAANTSKTLLIGVMLCDGIKNRAMIDAILSQARSEGYGVITCVSRDVEEELKNITMLLAHRVDGVLWQMVLPGHTIAKNEFLRNGVPFYTINNEFPGSDNNLSMDFYSAGYLVTEKLVNLKHQKIACIVTGAGYDVEAFVNGYKQCLYDGNIPPNDAYHLTWDESVSELDRLLLTRTGFVCFDSAAALDLMCHARAKNYRIPQDISILGLDAGEYGKNKDLSVLALPYAEFGAHCCRMLIAAMEGKKPEREFDVQMSVDGGSSVDIPITMRNKRIVVVGALNMDTLVNVSCFPTMGETTTAKSYAILPGGKGANQAIGAAKLGADICLIGRCGKDFQRDALMDSLLAHNIDVSAVKTDPDIATGHAYIYVQENGESSIVIYEGANRNLTPGDIEEAATSFCNASFCLLQTEIRGDTVECAARIAKEHGVKVLLKPAAITEISDSLLQRIDIFMPNHKELERLLPGGGTIEEKAQHFLDKGVGTVIVTLAHKGCYLRDAEHSEYFPAADFQAVDTTGAADAFAATLAVYLTEGRDIVSAIRYANYAAGFSVTRQGVPPSLADRSTLELYLSNTQ